MKPGRLLLSLLSFAAGAAVTLVSFSWFSPVSSGLGKRSEAAFPVLPVPPAGAESRSEAGEKAEADRETGNFHLAPELLGLAGLSAPPTVEDVLRAGGLDRQLRMALFLQNATTADLKAMMDRCLDENINEPGLTEGLWLRWVEIDREDALRQPQFMAAFGALAALDPEGAVAAAAKEGRASLSAAMAAIGRSDHTAALALLKQYPEVDVHAVWEGILEGWRKTDPAGAVAAALEKGLGLKETVESWTISDPSAALAWAKNQENPARRRQVLEMALGQLMAADPATALRETGELPPGRLRSELTGKALTALARTDASAALEAARALPNPVDRRKALAGISVGLASSDPALALQIGTDLVVSPAGRAVAGWTYQSADGSVKFGQLENPNFTLEMMGQLMAAAPEASADAFAALPEGASVQAGAMMQTWANRDPEAASRWLRGLPEGSFRNTAIAGLTDWLLHASPEPDFDAAVAWSLAAPPEQQGGLLMSTFQTWKAENPEAARAALDRYPLTPEQRELFLLVLQ
ncbi:MAG: hypothetical protein V4726_18655 [Verrucomicrobiota bacterium]